MQSFGEALAEKASTYMDERDYSNSVNYEKSKVKYETQIQRVKADLWKAAMKGKTIVTTVYRGSNLDVDRTFYLNQPLFSMLAKEWDIDMRYSYALDKAPNGGWEVIIIWNWEKVKVE